MTSLYRDILHAFRTVSRSPLLSMAIVLTLALGIGANVALFTVIDSVLLRPLSLPAPEQVTMVWETIPPSGRGTVSLPDLEDWRAQSTAFEALAAYRNTSFT